MRRLTMTRRVQVAVVAAILLVLSVTTGLFVFKQSKRNETVSVDELTTALQKTEEATGNVSKENRVFSQEETGKWNEVYKDPFVQHIRVAINGYLDGSNTGISDPELVINPLPTDKDHRTGLSTFRSYFKGKFIVLSIAGSPNGGKEITILFQNRPDKAFWVWVYHAAGTDIYDLRGIAESNQFSQDFIQSFPKNYGAMLDDKVHAL